MLYEYSQPTIIFVIITVAALLGISFLLRPRVKTANSFYAAGGQIHWFVNGIALAGDYLSVAAFPVLCGFIGFYGVDGFLLSMVCLAGWIVALVIAGPIKRLGRFTFADVLDSRFNSRGIRLMAGISTLVIAMLYLIPQMVIAGKTLSPLLGLQYYQSVLLIGVTVMLIVVTAGMAATTWVQFIKGALLVVVCMILTGLILHRGFSTSPNPPVGKLHSFAVVKPDAMLRVPGIKLVPEKGAWVGQPFVIMENNNGFRAIMHKEADGRLSETQSITNPQILGDGTIETVVNGIFQGDGPGEDLYPVGSVLQLPNEGTETGPLNPWAFLTTFQRSKILLWWWDGVPIKENSHLTTTVYYRREISGSDLLSPGQYFTAFKGGNLEDKFDFLSLLLALFCGTAALPHILVRFYTVKDATAARKSALLGIAAIGLFFILALYVGIGAMTSGSLDPTNMNTAVLLLGKSFGEPLFATVAALALITVLGTACGLIVAASGAIAIDLFENVLRVEMHDEQGLRTGRWAAAFFGIAAIVLGIAFGNFNVTILIGWAFAVAAAANLPALVMLVVWKRTTRQGIIAAVTVGLFSSLSLLLLSADCFKHFYGLPPDNSPIPFSQPALITIPLGFIVLIVVSRLTPARALEPAAAK